MENKKDFKKRMHRQKEKSEKYDAIARKNKLANGWKEDSRKNEWGDE